MYISDQVPGWSAALEEQLDGDGRVFQLGIAGHVHAAPKISEHGRRKEFDAHHGRGGDGQQREFPVQWQRHDRFAGALDAIRRGAQCCDKAGYEVTPIGQLRRQGNADAIGTKTQQSVT